MKIDIYQPLTFRELGKRDNQEDSVAPAPGETTTADRLFVLCDGMGGHENGEVASGTVCDTIVGYLNSHWKKDEPLPDQLLLDALERACCQVDALDSGEGKGMGTTLTLVALHAGGCTAMHLGDSRIYHLRTSERRWAYISRDHSLVFDLYQAGEISYEQMRTSSQRNIITKAIRAGKGERSRPDIVHIGDLQPDDYLFLCSDGVPEQLDNDSLLQLLCGKQSDQEKMRRLVQLTQNSHDNHSAHLIHISGVELEPGEKPADDERTSRCNALNVIPRGAALPQPQRKTGWWLWLALAVIAVGIAAFFLLSGQDKGDGQDPPASEIIEMKPITHSTE